MARLALFRQLMDRQQTAVLLVGLANLARHGVVDGPEGMPPVPQGAPGDPGFREARRI